MNTATQVEQSVANRVGSQMAKGASEPAAARRATVPVGAMSTMEEVLMARNSAMALVAEPRRVFRRSSSAMALMPKGVAALPRPSILAAKFMIMAPMAGWSGGTSGNSRSSSGRSARAMARNSPPRAAMRTSPKNSIIAPVSPITS